MSNNSSAMLVLSTCNVFAGCYQQWLDRKSKYINICGQCNFFSPQFSVSLSAPVSVFVVKQRTSAGCEIQSGSMNGQQPAYINVYPKTNTGLVLLLNQTMETTDMRAD